MDVTDAIRRHLADNVLYTGEFPYGDNASLLREGIIDSMGVMELVAFVHERFGVRADAREITPENFDSVAALTAYVRRKQAEPPTGGVPGGN
jgi:acyl carrier protein